MFAERFDPGRPYVFVSYARDDDDVVRAELRWLVENGVNLWYDDDIEPGAVWRTRIARAVLDASAVVFFVSARSVRSETCRKEISLALDEDRPVIPAYLEDVELPPDLRLALGDVQAVHLEGANSTRFRRSLLAELEAMTSDPTAADVEATQLDPTPALHNLPAVLTSLIGRSDEIERLRELMSAGGTRLVTLIGAGGIGKTRLAIEACRGVIAEFDNGVWLAELALVRDTALIAPAIANALGLKGDSERSPLDSLIYQLRGRSLLIVLDNCEHLLDACADLARRLLEDIPGLKVVATSRQALGVQGEVLFEVAPLTPPASQGLEALGANPAVQLFVDRAAAVRSNFALNEHTADAVAQICQRLDGLPLAIELAAARTKALDPAAIARRLDDRFRLLAGDRHNPIPHHQALRECIDWSYDQLGSQEKCLFRRAAYFAGSFDLDACESVCADESLAGPDVLDVLQQIIDKSLIQVEVQSSGTRYWLLETLREYARGQVSDDERSALRERHIAYFADLATRIEPELRQAEQLRWWSVLDEEYPNLRQAIDACVEDAADNEDGLRLAGMLWRFWGVRGRWREGLEACTCFLSRSVQANANRAGALVSGGRLSENIGDYPAARRYYDEAIEIYRREANGHGLARALDNLAVLNFREKDYAQACTLEEEALVLRRDLGDRYGESASLNNLGVYAEAMGKLDEAWDLYEQGLRIKQELHDVSVSTSHNNLGDVAYLRCDYPEARSYYQTGLRLARDVQATLDVAVALNGLGRVELHIGDSEEGRRYLLEGFAVFLKLSDRRAIAETLANLGTAATLSADFERAATLFGAAAELQGNPLDGLEPDDVRAAVARAREAMTKADFERAERTGRALGFDRACDFALNADATGALSG